MQIKKAAMAGTLESSDAEVSTIISVRVTMW